MHPVFNPITPYRYLLPNLYLSVIDIANPDLFPCGSRTWISLDIDRFCEEHCQSSGGSAWPACTNNSNRVPIAGGGRGRHNLHRVCQTAVTALPCVGCVVWSHVDVVTTSTMEHGGICYHVTCACRPGTIMYDRYTLELRRC